MTQKQGVLGGQMETVINVLIGLQKMIVQICVDGIIQFAHIVQVYQLHHAHKQDVVLPLAISVEIAEDKAAQHVLTMLDALL